MRRVGRTRFGHATYPSPYLPGSGVPGAARFARDTDNHVVHSWMLRQTVRAPWVVCLHGAGMGDPLADMFAFRAAYLHRCGFNVAIPVLPHHGPRGAGRFEVAFPTEEPAVNLHAAAQAIADVRALLAYIANSDEPAVLFGISLGAYVRGGGRGARTGARRSDRRRTSRRHRRSDVHTRAATIRPPSPFRRLLHDLATTRRRDVRAGITRAGRASGNAFDLGGPRGPARASRAGAAARGPVGRPRRVLVRGRTYGVSHGAFGPPLHRHGARRRWNRSGSRRPTGGSHVSAHTRRFRFRSCYPRIGNRRSAASRSSVDCIVFVTCA